MKTKYTIHNVEWKQGDLGWYWVADLHEDGKQIGITGNYYDIEERLPVPPVGPLKYSSELLGNVLLPPFEG